MNATNIDVHLTLNDKKSLSNKHEIEGMPSTALSGLYAASSTVEADIYLFAEAVSEIFLYTMPV